MAEHIVRLQSSEPLDQVVDNFFRRDLEIIFKDPKLHVRTDDFCSCPGLPQPDSFFLLIV